jgi:hypothetical protein
MYTLSQHLMYEHTPPGGIHAGEQTCSLASGAAGPQPNYEHSHLQYFTKRLFLGAYTAPGEASAPLEHQKRPLLPGI